MPAPHRPLKCLNYIHVRYFLLTGSWPAAPARTRPRSPLSDLEPGRPRRLRRGRPARCRCCHVAALLPLQSGCRQAPPCAADAPCVLECGRRPPTGSGRRSLRPARQRRPPTSVDLDLLSTLIHHDRQTSATAYSAVSCTAESIAARAPLAPRLARGRGELAAAVAALSARAGRGRRAGDPP